MDPETLILGFAWYVVFVFSTVCHEGAHALVAWRLGDPTAYHAGQVSLDPIPHLRREPLGMCVVPILSYFLNGWMIGWASAPYDPNWAYRFPRRSALMALAGPVANLLLVIVAAVGVRVGLALDVFYVPDRVGFTEIVGCHSDGFLKGVASFLGILLTLNLILCVFNLFPLPPLDGSGVLPIFLPTRMARAYLDTLWKNPMYALLGLVVAWKFFGSIFWPIRSFVLMLMFSGHT